MIVHPITNHPKSDNKPPLIREPGRAGASRASRGEPGEPDRDGTQLQAIKAYLDAHPDVQYLWYDAWCVPNAHTVPALATACVHSSHCGVCTV